MEKITKEQLQNVIINISGQRPEIMEWFERTQWNWGKPLNSIGIVLTPIEAYVVWFHITDASDENLKGINRFLSIYEVVDDLKISYVNGKRFYSLSPHPTRFWTGEIVSPAPQKVIDATSLEDESITDYTNGGFECILFKKYLPLLGKDVINAIIIDVDFLLVPAMYASLLPSQWEGVDPNGKIVAVVATPETQRAKPDEKIASNKLSIIW